MCRGAQRCTEVCGGVRGGARRCAEGYTEGCMEVHRGVCRGAWRCMEGCVEVCRGARRGAWRWLPLATINLVGDSREFESMRHILRSYTHYIWLIISEH